MSGWGLAAAFGGGVASFLSPCVLPVVPGYLSVLAGLDALDRPASPARRRVRLARDTALFCAGFAAVFVALGLTATAVGRALARHHALLTRLSGGLVIAMALFLAGSLLLRAPGLYGERRFHPTLARFGRFAAPVAGAAFAFGWTPCIGPVLGSVLGVAATEGQAVRATALLAAYSAGLAVPFLVAGLAYGRVAGTLARARRFLPAVTAATAAALLGLGVLLVLDRLGWVTAALQSGLADVGLGRLVTLG